MKARYTYDPWGGVIAVEKNLDSYERDIVEMNPLLYRGYVYDSETGLYYLQSRYYDPEVGRFINCDDVRYIGATQTELSYNPFSYCANDPVNNYDPSGLIAMSTCVIIGIGIGALIGGSIGYVLATKNGYTVKDGWEFWQYICGGIVIGGVAGGILGYFGGAYFGASGIKAGSLASKISMSKIRTLGKMGEKLAKIKKNTQRIESINKTAKYRIPDILDKKLKIIGDVKYVKKQAYTRQLKDYVAYADKYGYTVQLFLKPDTILTKPLKAAVDAGKIVIYFITK